MTLGVRNTYKIGAPYNMTKADVRHQSRFYDSIGIFPELVDAYGILIVSTTGRYFQMPFSALVPKSVFNLMVVGRITGSDKFSYAASRNIMCCAVSGQGAGAAAAISVSHGLSFPDMDTDLLQKELQQQGARLH